MAKRDMDEMALRALLRAMAARNFSIEKSLDWQSRDQFLFLGEDSLPPLREFSAARSSGMD